MADTKLTGLTATTTPVLTDYGYIVTTPGGTPASHYATLDTLQQILSVKNVSDGRLTLETGVPVSMTDQANKTTLYYTFYKGNKIGLYDGTSWHVRTFTELSIAVGALTASKPYDVFIYDNSGTPALELLVWTNATTRATALAYQDGVLVKSGAATRRYVGTIYIDSGQKCQDTALARYVWNYYNRVIRHCEFADATGHGYQSATAQYWNNNSASIVSMIVGVNEETQFVALTGDGKLNATGAGVYAALGFGVDDTTIISNKSVLILGLSGMRVRASVTVSHSCGLGYHFYSALESSDGTNTNTFNSIVLTVRLSG